MLGASSDVRISRDAAGRIVGTATWGGLATGRSTYAYDGAGQLVSTRTSDLNPLTPRTQAWSYDTTGNRVTATTDGVRTSSAYDAGGRLASETTRGRTTTFGYDAAGRRVLETGPGTSQAFTYDAAGRLDATVSRLGSHSVTERRTYDGDGLLVGTASTRGSRTVATSLAWDPTGATPELLAATTSGTTAGTSASYVHGVLGPLGLVRGNGSSATFAKDAFGSVSTTLWTADAATSPGYDAFGEADLKLSLSDLTLTPTFGYRGELTIGEDYYLVERNYDPETGQLLSPDPVSQPGGSPSATNEYAYVANDPLNLVDPLGLSPIADVSMAGLGVGSIIAAASPYAPDITEWSAQHRAVQADFAMTKRPGARLEVWVPNAGVNGNGGRADIVDAPEIWEVKTARWHGDPVKYGIAQRQLAAYVSNLPGKLGATCGEYAFPYQRGQLVVKSHGDPGMLWYYYRAGQPRRVPVPVPVPVPAPVRVPNPAPQPAPVPPPAQTSPSTGWQPPSWLGPVVGGVVVVGGVALIVGTLVEDVATAGVGIIDDPVTLAAGGGMVTWGWAAMFGLGTVAAAGS